MTQTEAIFKAIGELNKLVDGKVFAVGDKQTVDLNVKPGANMVMVGAELHEPKVWEFYKDLPMRFTFIKTEEPDDWKLVDPLEDFKNKPDFGFEQEYHD
jgi:hypothetical protein